METAAITAWLASAQPYASGVALYAQVGTNKTYQRLFALPATDYSRQVLVRELRALVPPAPPEAVVDRPAAPPLVAAPPAPLLPVPTADPPAALAQVRDQLRAARDERSYLHPQLTAEGVSKDVRRAVASRILDITDEETRLKGLEAHVLAHGRLPGPVATAELTDAGELRQRLTNRLSLRSKLRKRADRSADLAAVEEEILLIRSKLTP